jgi:hypothetical protein
MLGIFRNPSPVPNVLVDRVVDIPGLSHLEGPRRTSLQRIPIVLLSFTRQKLECAA